MSARQRIDPIRPAASGDGSVKVGWKLERKVEGRRWPGAVAVLPTLPSTQTGLAAELGVKGLRTREQAVDEARRTCAESRGQNVFTARGLSAASGVVRQPGL